MKAPLPHSRGTNPLSRPVARLWLVLLISAGCEKTVGIVQDASQDTAPTASQAISAPQAITVKARSLQGAPPTSFREIVKPARKAVVNLFTVNPSLIATGPLDDTESKPPQQRQLVAKLPRKRQAESLGSGFLFDNKEGLLLTNWHVIKGTDEIVARFLDESSYRAELVGFDPNSDLAVLRLPQLRDLPRNKVPTALRFAPNGSLEVGDWVVAIGNPYGLSHTVTAGIVSATGRKYLGANTQAAKNETDGLLYQDFIQTDASINPGNSGGPLLNLKGEIVGLNTAIYERGYGLGFAIPGQMIKELLPQLTKGGQVSHGWLGAKVITAPKPLVNELKITAGVLIKSVVAGGPASQSGLKKGDVVILADGREMQTTHDIAWTIGRMRPGETVDLVFRRGDETKEIKVRLIAKPSSP